MFGLKERPERQSDGRVYGGREQYIHIKDGQRARFAREVAEFITTKMKAEAVARGSRTQEQADVQSPCPGCSMIIVFNVAIILACQSGQSLREMAISLGKAFTTLARMVPVAKRAGLDLCKEHIDVVLVD